MNGAAGRRGLGLRLHLLDGVGARLQGRGQALRFGFVWYLQLVALANDARQLRFERGWRALFLQLRFDRPEFDGLEVEDLALALGHQSDGDGLHTPGTQAFTDLSPQERAQSVSNEPVEDAPRLLCIYQVHVDVARVLEGLADRIRGDLVEYDALQSRRAEVCRLEQVPGDRLALAVGVGGEIDSSSLAGGVADLLDGLRLLFRHDVSRQEAVIDFDAHVVLRQVPHVAYGGLYVIVCAQNARNRPRLGGRFDYDQALSVSFSQLLSLLLPLIPWYLTCQRALT